MGTVMGRGRNKAKQQKVARDLKYRGDDLDLNALAEELRSDANTVTLAKKDNSSQQSK
jgi:hypothetical protein